MVRQAHHERGGATTNGVRTRRERGVCHCERGRAIACRVRPPLIEAVGWVKAHEATPRSS